MIGCFVFIEAHPRPSGSLCVCFKIFRSQIVTFSSTLRPRKFFICNTYESSRKCCKQKTYGIAKSFSCNTYRKHGGTILQAKSFSPSARFAAFSLLFEPPILRTLFQVPYALTPLLATLTKTAGVYTNNSHNGTSSRPFPPASSLQFQSSLFSVTSVFSTLSVASVLIPFLSLNFQLSTSSGGRFICTRLQEC